MRSWLNWDRKVVHTLGLILVMKLLAYTGVRVIYPLAPFLQEDWDISRADFGTILAVSEVAAVPAVFIAPFADKHSVKLVATISWLLMTFSVFLLAIDLTESVVNETSTNTDTEISTSNESMFTLILLSRIIFVLGYQLFFTTSLSVALRVVADKNKLLAAGFVETSWSIAALLCVPILAYVYGATSFQVMFISFAILMLLCTFDMVFVFPSKTFNHADNEFSMLQMVKELNHISVYSFNIHSIFLFIAQNGIFTVFSFWCSDEFGISVDDVGTSFFVIGGSELFGCFLYIVVSAKKSSQLYNCSYFFTLTFIMALVGLIFVNTFSAGLVMIFFVFLSAEFITLFTIADTDSYVKPEFRNSVIGFHSVCMFIGRSLGALLGERLYSRYDISTSSYLFIASLVVSIGLLAVGHKFKRSFAPGVEKPEVNEGSNSEEDKSSNTK